MTSTPIGFGSVWVANHHGQSVSRIDPRRDRVVAQPAVGDPHAYRAGPQLMADDGSRLYVGVSANQSLTSIGPAHSRVSSVWSTPTDQFCGDLVVWHRQVWSVDLCSNTLYRLTPGPRHITAFGYGTAALTSAALLDDTGRSAR
jgi:streptogramin lyase